MKNKKFGFDLFDFQKDTKNIAVDFLLENNGVVIMDDTGLGKTITAIATILDSVDNIGDIKLLVISPISNIKSWNKALSTTEIDFEVLNVDKIKKIDNNNYTHFIIDECHNFRSNGIKYMNLFKLINSQINRPYVVMLSATIFNNNYTELKYIFSLIPFKPNSVPFLLLGNVLNNIIECEKDIEKYNMYNTSHWKIQNELIKKRFKLSSLKNELNKVLSFFTVRKSRNIIENNYKSDLLKMGSFPIVNNRDKFELKSNTRELYDIFNIIENSPLVKWRINNYITDFIENKDVNYDLSSLYKTVLAKRMESSIHSFINTIDKSLNSLIELKSSRNTTYGKNKINVSDKFWIDLDKDIENFNKILKISNDYINSNSNLDNEKLNILLEVLSENSKKGIKTIVFTEYLDTLNLIEQFINNTNIKYITYSSKSNEKDLNEIITNFDANLPLNEQKNTISVILATDVLSEGISLHRANSIIHFDNRWNPSRIIQRNGRVNRIHMNNFHTKNIDVFSFEINNIIESYIKLQDKNTYKTNESNYILDNQYSDINYSKVDCFESNTIKGIIQNNINENYMVLRTDYRDITFNINNGSFLLNTKISIDYNANINKASNIYTSNDEKLMYNINICNLFGFTNNLLHSLISHVKNNHPNIINTIYNPLYSKTYYEMLKDSTNILESINNTIKYVYNSDSFKNSLMKVTINEHGSPYLYHKLKNKKKPL